MGHSSSKHKHKSSDKLGVATTTTSKPPTTTVTQQKSSTQKLQPPIRPSKHSTHSHGSSHKSNLATEARILGSGNTEAIPETSNAKEASARAAEERFKKLQNQQSGQKERIRSKAINREKAV